MKFQNPKIHRSKVNTHTHTHTHTQTDRQTDKPKAICPSNFFKVGGINIGVLIKTGFQTIANFLCCNMRPLISMSPCHSVTNVTFYTKFILNAMFS